MLTVVVAGEEARELPTHVPLQGGGLFAFADLYTRAPDGRDTCTIVTTSANEVIAPFHSRMSVILDGGCEALWPDRSVTDPQAVQPCLAPFQAERMGTYRWPTWCRRRGTRGRS